MPLMCTENPGRYAGSALLWISVVNYCLPVIVLNRVNVLIYFQYLFEQIPLRQAGSDKDYMADMRPWSERYRTYEEKKQQRCRSMYG